MFKRQIKGSSILRYCNKQASTNSNQIVNQQQTISYADFTNSISSENQNSEFSVYSRVGGRIVEELGVDKLLNIIKDEVKCIEGNGSQENKKEKDVLNMFEDEFKPLKQYIEEEGTTLSFDPVTSFGKIMFEAVSAIYSKFQSVFSAVSSQIRSLFPNSSRKQNTEKKSSNTMEEDMLMRIVKGSIIVVSLYTVSLFCLQYKFPVATGITERVLKAAKFYSQSMFSRRSFQPPQK